MARSSPHRHRNLKTGAAETLVPSLFPCSSNREALLWEKELVCSCNIGLASAEPLKSSPQRMRSCPLLPLKLQNYADKQGDRNTCLCLKDFARNYLQETMAMMKLSTRVSEPLIHVFSHSHSRKAAPQFRRLETSAVVLDLCHRKSFHLNEAAVIYGLKYTWGKTLLGESMLTKILFLKICLA